MQFSYLGRKRAWLLLLQVPLLAAEFSLVYQVPLDPARKIRIDNSGHVLLVQAGSANWELDVATGKHQRPAETETKQIRNVAAPVWITPTNRDANWRWQAEIISADGTSQRDVIEFEFPTHPSYLGERFVIGTTAGARHILDLRDPLLTVQETPAISSLEPQLIPGSNNFCEFDNTTVVRSIVLHEVLNGGHTRQVARWTTDSTWVDLSLDGRLRTISPDRKMLETRAVADGQLLQRQPLPAAINPQASGLGTLQHFLVEYSVDSSGFRYERFFDLDIGQAIDIPKMQTQQIPRLETQGLWMFVGWDSNYRNQVIVYDQPKHQVLFRTQAGANAFGNFLDEHQVVVASLNHGLTAKVFDLQTGQVTATFRPWWWVSPWLVACTLGGVLWAFAWVRAGPTHSSWCVIDILILTSLGMVPLILRIKTVGDPTDLERLVFAYSQAIFLALAQLCAVWIIFGRKASWLLRMLPMAIVLSALLVLLNHLFITPEKRVLFNPKWMAWTGLVSTAAPTALTALSFGCLRLMKFRLHVQSDDDNPTSTPIPHLPLRDIFIAVSCAGLLVAAAKPLLAHIPQAPPNVPGEVIAAVGVSIMAHNLFLIFAFAANRRWTQLGGVIVGCLILVLIAIPVLQFADPTPLPRSTERWFRPFLIAGISLVWFYAFLLTFRHHNQLRWQRGTLSSYEELANPGRR